MKYKNKLMQLNVDNLEIEDKLLNLGIDYDIWSGIHTYNYCEDMYISYNDSNILEAIESNDQERTIKLTDSQKINIMQHLKEEGLESIAEHARQLFYCSAISYLNENYNLEINCGRYDGNITIERLDRRREELSEIIEEIERNQNLIKNDEDSNIDYRNIYKYYIEAMQENKKILKELEGVIKIIEGWQEDLIETYKEVLWDDVYQYIKEIEVNYE